MRYCMLVLSLLFLLGCDDVSFSPMIGKWQLKTIEKDGVVTPVDTVWYNFQSISIFSLQIYEAHRDGYLSFEGLRKQKDKVCAIEIFNEAVLRYSDWTSLHRSFTIEQLNRRRLLLRSEEGVLYSFVKF